jgi:hypothetical protein
LVNESDEDVELKQGWAISFLNQVQEVLEINVTADDVSGDQRETGDNKVLPAHMEALFASSGQNLEEQDK